LLDTDGAPLTAPLDLGAAYATLAPVVAAGPEGYVVFWAPLNGGWGLDAITCL
jgi:hypothetical protein